jgi:hypothetical protein
MSNRVDDRLGPAVDPVERADRQDRALPRPRRRIEVRDELHDQGRYLRERSTT